MSRYFIHVRGERSEWPVYVDERSVEAMRADGFEVFELVNTIPEWVVDAGMMTPLASIVPDGCAGATFVFELGHLHVTKDGSGYFCVPDAEMAFEDDRDEGPDGAEGSVHWIARMDASEITALRDFLNGVPVAQPTSQFLATEDGEFNGNTFSAQPAPVAIT